MPKSATIQQDIIGDRCLTYALDTATVNDIMADLDVTHGNQPSIIPIPHEPYSVMLHWHETADFYGAAIILTY